MENAIKIFVIEDNATMREGLEQVLSHYGYSVKAFDRAEKALPEIATESPALLICDYKLPGMDGLTALAEIRQAHPLLEVIMITAFGSIDLAVTAMQNGAADFITKPFSADEIGIKIERLLQRIDERKKMNHLEAENVYLREQLDAPFQNGDIIGDSPVMREVFKTIEKVARTDSSVMIYGESGTGKELVARALHKNSHRRARPFIRVNCSALAEGVLESELFGHEKGSFTGALRRKLGRFELAHEGTIFLDEIGDISPAMQLRLLRVLQEKEFERVGGEETLRVDVRVVAATNHNLKEDVEAGGFREDLYYRLHIVPINMPPLRARLEDVPLLARHFLARIRVATRKPELTLQDNALAALQEYHWPGNVRELENVLERAAVLCESDAIGADDLPLLVKDRSAILTLNENQLDLNATLEQVEQALIERAMKLAHGVKAEAARKLGIKTTTLLYKLTKYGME
ncbi:MAG: sigma-54-dependent Fis family transcriptional regulator [Deferribacteres bacterium]|nr:sigma-54-dependent Fis family transcriptional regulator [Deferribacteres bacterium]